MEIKLSQDKITEIFEILDQEENYGKIKLFSLYIMKAAKQPYENLHGEVKIIFNPYRSMLFEHTEDIGLEHYFDFETIWGEVQLTQNENFKKAFVLALNEMMNVDFFKNDY